MKRNILIIPFITIAFFSLAACNLTGNEADQQSAINTAVAATQSANSNNQAAIETAVKATIQAQNKMETATEQAIQATLTAHPTPGYTPLNEEERAALIDQAVAEALAASETASSSTTASTADGIVTAEEVTDTYTYLYDTNYAIAYAEELIEAYYEYYGDYADSALNELQEIEEDLSTIVASMEEITAILDDGAEAATAAIEQLNAAAAQTQAQLQEAQAKADFWQQTVKTNLDQRENDILNMTPNQTATNPAEALNQAHDFLETFKAALGDGKFSPEELLNIGQLSANVRASFEQLGGRSGEFGNFQGAIENLTRQAARGDWGSARSGIGDLEHSLPVRPSRPSRP